MDIDHAHNLPWHVQIRARMVGCWTCICYHLLKLFPIWMLCDSVAQRARERTIFMGPYDAASIRIKTDNPENPVYEVQTEGCQWIFLENGYTRL